LLEDLDGEFAGWAGISSVLSGSEWAEWLRSRLRIEKDRDKMR